MKELYQTHLRPALAVLTAGVMLGGLLTASAQTGMYHMGLNYAPGTVAPYNSGGGVPAQSLMAIPIITSSNSTFSWYGMKGWSTVQGSTNGGLNWLNLANVAATDYSWTTTFANPFGVSALFRLSQNNAYVGQSACASCHADYYNGWTNTAHSHAIREMMNPDGSLLPYRDPSCIVCHSVGMNQPGGYVFNTNNGAANYTSALANVGCEACHGPAGWHKSSDKDMIRPAVSIDPAICGSCHQDSHHPTFEEYATTLHAEVNDDVKYGFSSGVYYTNTITLGGTNVYGYYVTTNANLTLKTNVTTGIISSLNGAPYLAARGYDPGQDRAVGCGICHSAATRMAMLNDFEARQAGTTNYLAMPVAKDSAAWSATCATCHDPHSNANVAQLRNPTFSTNFYTMPTTSDKRTVLTPNPSGGVTTNVYWMSAAFASMYNPNIQICGQCHNTRGARWDGLSYGLITTANYSTNVTVAGLVPMTTAVTNVQVFTNITYGYIYTNGASVGVTNALITTNSFVINYVTNEVWMPSITSFVTNNAITTGLTTNISYSRPPHHSHQYNILVGNVQEDYLPVVSHPHRTITNQCVACHMPSYAVNASTNITGHTFALDTKGCSLAGCHTSYSESALEKKIEDLQDQETNSISGLVQLLNQWATNKAPALLGATDYNKSLQNSWEFTTIGTLATLTNTGPSASKQLILPAAIRKARYNLYMVAYDSSLGVHNPSYTKYMLADAETNVLSQMTDVPASFRANTLVGDAPLTVKFTNLCATAAGGNWAFGDGGTTNVLNPTYVYNTPGTYPVTFTETGGNTLTRPNYIVVRQKPTLSLTANVVTGAAPLTVTFTNTSYNTSSVDWYRYTFITTNSATRLDSPDLVVSYTYTNAGTYSVSLRATVYGGSSTPTVTNLNYITVTNAVP